MNLQDSGVFMYNLRFYKEFNGYLPDPLPGRLGDKKGYLYSSAGGRGIEIMPGVFSTDHKAWEWQKDLIYNLTYELPQDEWLGQGFASTGVENGWLNLCTVMGMPALPMGTAPSDLISYRDRELRLSKNPIHHEFADNPMYNKRESITTRIVCDLLLGAPFDHYNIPVKVDSMLGLWDMDFGINAPGDRDRPPCTLR